MDYEYAHALANWIEHCKKPEIIMSSSIMPVVDCASYDQIKTMGRQVLPYILETLEMDVTNNFHLSMVKSGLVPLVKDIVGDEFKIPDHLRGRVLAIEDYTVQFLKKQTGTYIN